VPPIATIRPGPGLAAAFFALALIAAPAPLWGQSAPLAAAPPGYVEIGTPPFVVLGPEALGLDTSPVDLHRMPDGRFLAFGHGEFAIGDGVRWEAFKQADDETPIPTTAVAVDDGGAIYAGLPGGFGRVEFGRDGRWRLRRVERIPDDLADETGPLTQVSMVGSQWFWSWGNGPVVEWHPGAKAVTVGHINAMERVFQIGEEVCLSDQSNGSLYGLKAGRFEKLGWKHDRFVSETITAGVPMADGSTLLGTISVGLVRYDGTSLKPLVDQGPLSGDHRIDDLCDVGGGYIAVALDEVGVVFIDQRGHIVQSIDRSVDNRLARVKRLIREPNGSLWALLNEGVAKVAFPAQYSSMESLVTTGLSYSRPFRRGGKLWLMSDGQAERGVYNTDNRLIRFEVETPDFSYLTTLIDLDGAWLATSENGVFRYGTTGGWTRIIAGPISMNIRQEPVETGRWLYAAEDEVGWIRRDGNLITAERHTRPGMGHVYGIVTDSHGIVWAELGTARAARIEAAMPEPKVEILAPPKGAHQSWMQLFLYMGEVRANVNGQILRYDPAHHALILDNELMRRFPALSGSLGRPTVDSKGRFWIARPDSIQVVDTKTLKPVTTVEAPPSGIRPLYFTAQTDGVVWLNEPKRLARFDPSLPAPEPPPPGAVITRVELPASGVTLYPAAGTVSDLSPTENTVLVHFAASSQPVGETVTFEVRLSGSTEGWVSTGSLGSISFNRLDFGTYHLSVRPRLGALIGTEAGLRFTILAPWYRTRLAYLLFGAGILGAVVGAVGLSLFVQKAEKTRLERVVTARTGELKATNKELARQIRETMEKSDALRASEERFRRLYDNAPDILFRVRVVPDVGYDYISPAVTAISGYRPEEFIADPTLIRRISRPEGAETIYDQAVARSVPDHVLEVQWATRDGRVVTLEEHLTSITDPSGNLVAIEGIARDVTERHEEQERARRLEAQLLQSQKLETVGTLAGGIAHDFNNILTGILGYCDLAWTSVAGIPEGAEALREIRSAGLRAKDLVTRILTFSRRTEVRLAAVNLAEVVREAMGLVRASTPMTVEIRADLADGVILADSTQIHQVVVNLCTNGVHAMQGRGAVLEVSVRPLPFDPKLAQEIPHLPPGPCVLLSVSDNGAGMAPETLQRIFDPFFTTKDSGQGTGLGLSIVQGIITSHGAAFRILSAMGRGTTFEIYFPSTQFRPIRAEAYAAPAAGEGRRVLVVDDEVSVASVISAALKRVDYRVTTFHDPKEALSAFAADPSGFDAVVTDMTMPHMTGLELIHAVRAIRPDMPAVLTSGYNKALTSVPANFAPNSRLLSKPFDATELARVVGQVLEDAAPPRQGPARGTA
jgi:PAS domain S-box-containing protein